MGCGDITAGLAEAEHCLEGSMRLGGQKHFYMETNACIAIPKGEDGEMELWASTQNLNLTQMSAAKTLGISANKITARVKRIGNDKISKRMHIKQASCTGFSVSNEFILVGKKNIVGGGFGGKAMRSTLISTAMSTAAHKYVQKVRFSRWQAVPTPS